MTGSRRPHLLFTVAKRAFALPLDAVDRIVPPDGLLPVTSAAVGLRGLLRLPDDVVAVLDLAPIFGLKAAAPSAESCVLATSRDDGSEGLAGGLLVDAIERVLELARTEIAAPPRAGGLFAARWIAGMARTKRGLVPILDLANLLEEPVVHAAMRAAANAAGKLRRGHRS